MLQGNGISHGVSSRRVRQFEQNGKLPRLNIIRLGNDHTAGTRAGAA